MVRIDITDPHKKRLVFRVFVKKTRRPVSDPRTLIMFQRIDIWRAHDWITIASQRIGTQLITGNKQNIEMGRIHLSARHAIGSVMAIGIGLKFFVLVHENNFLHLSDLKINDRPMATKHQAVPEVHLRAKQQAR